MLSDSKLSVDAQGRLMVLWRFQHNNDTHFSKRLTHVSFYDVMRQLFLRLSLLKLIRK
jgi:hypothetical protein